VKKNLWFTAVSLFLLVGCQPPQEPINVVGNSWLGYQPLYAQHVLHPEQQPSNVHLTMLVSDISVVRMLTNQAASVAMLSLDNAISLNSRTDLDFCIALALSSSNGADAILARPDFVPQLKTEAPIRVGMEDSALARYVVSRWLEEHDIDESRVNRIIVLPPGQLAALNTRSVDVIATYAPFTQNLIEAGAEVIFSSHEIPDEIIDTIVVRKSTWQQHKERLLPFVTTAWDNALTQAKVPNSEIFNAMMKLSELSAQELNASMAQLKFYSAKDSREFLTTRYTQVSSKVADHLQDSAIFDAPKMVPVCEGILP
jgi:NitT/TauT family transport system substrate-binding protein